MEAHLYLQHAQSCLEMLPGESPAVQWALLALAEAFIDIAEGLADEEVANALRSVGRLH